MKRLIVIGLSVLMLVGFSADAVAMSDCDKQQFIDELKDAVAMGHGDRDSYLVLIEAPNGCWKWGFTFDGHTGTRLRDQLCRKECKSRKSCKRLLSTNVRYILQGPDSHYIKSFIRNRGTCSSSSTASTTSSTASSSDKIWCATKDSVTWISKNYCRQEGGKSYSYKTQAKAEHKRLKKSSSTASSSGDIWCATKYSVRWISRYSCAQDKGKAFNKYSSALAEKKRLNKSSSSYSTASSSSSTGEKINYANGDRYVGEILDGIPHGYGTYIFANGNKYVGNFKDGKSHGYGTLTYGKGEWEGEKYVGNFKDGNMHGYGTYIHANGSKYVGEHSLGERHGQGTFTWNNGNKLVGDAKRGKPWNVIMYDSVGTITGVYTDGKWCDGCKPDSASTASSSESLIWCATRYSVEETTRHLCKQNKGKAFSSYISAKGEQGKLENSIASRVFCATASMYWATDWISCDRSSGKTFYTEHLAKAEYKRLKAAATPVVKTASLTIRSNVNGDSVYIDGQYKGSTRLDLKLSKGRHTIRIEKDGYKTYEESVDLTDNLIIRGHLEKIVDSPVKTVVVDNTVEVEFWNSIKGSDDPDEYRIYLDEYPAGKFAKLAKLRIKKLGGTTIPVAQPSIPNLDYGRYHALVIGNNRYEHFSDLRTAVNDARTVSRLLERDYGFKVSLLENATRSKILSSINKLRTEVDRQDNVLIYYAGHGYLDPDTDEGFWIPIDAERNDESNWLLTDRVRSKIKAMPAKHVMVVADSCFSGKFTRSAITRGLKIEPRSSEYVPALQRLIEKKSRTALTSGGLEPVLDSGSGGGHSVFAEVFISILNDNEGVLDAAGLFSQLRPKVINNSDQTPEYSTIHQGGHDGGDFLFVRR